MGALGDGGLDAVYGQRHRRRLALLSRLFGRSRLVPASRAARQLGEVLYRDVAWAYGPLPAQALAALFRWLGPDAAWVSLINAALTVTGVLLTYAVTRSVLSGVGAFLVTAFATLVGPNLWGGLFHIYFFTYTQAIAWGAVLSLAALASALHWQQTRQNSWILLAGLATGLAILSKPEFGLTALGASAVVIAAGRGPAGVWWRYLLTCGLTAGMGFGWQSSFAGWWPVWRGYTGYSQVADRSGSLWGTYLGNKRLLLGGYVLWLAVAALWACRHWPRRRLVVFVLVFLVGLGVLTAGLLSMPGSALLEILRQDVSSWTLSIPSMASFLTALPWAPILPLLLGAGWLARKRPLPPAWWGLWAYAVISNLRLLLTGYANGLAVAPALAVFWVWIESHPATPEDRQRGRRIALAILAGLALFSLVAQVIVPNPLFNRPRVWMDSAVGPLQIAQPFQESYKSMAAFIDRTVPVGTPIFAGDYGTQWYLLTQRPNPTGFDVFITGLGISRPRPER